MKIKNNIDYKQIMKNYEKKDDCEIVLKKVSIKKIAYLLKSSKNLKIKKEEKELKKAEKIIKIN